MMPNRRTLSLLATLASFACTPAPERAKPQTDDQAKHEPADEADIAMPAVDEPDYSSFGMPGLDTAWSVADYSAAREAVTAIAKQDPKLLPRDGSPTFARLAEIDHLRELAAGITPEQLAGLSISLGTVHMIYGDQTRVDPEIEREQLILTAALIAVTTKLPASTVQTEADATALRSEPARLKGLLRFRHGIYEMVAGMLEPEPQSVLAPSFACEQLARVIDDAAPLLLEEERTTLREQARACVGARAEAIAQLERALASEAPTAALVTALLPEHREFAATL